MFFGLRPPAAPPAAEPEIDVLVVGAGPAGLTAALTLASYGLRVHALTQFPWLANSPRAHITNQRTMEVLRDLGVDDEVMTYGSPWDQMGDTLFTTSLAGPEIARIRAWGSGDDEHGRYVRSSPSEMVDVPQPYLESVLVRNAGERGARVRFNTEYLGHTQHSGGVDVRVRETLSGTESVVRAKYLVGADGARSAVARDINLEFEGDMGRGSTVYVRFEADLTHLVAHRPSILYWIVSDGGAYGEIGLGLLRAVRQWGEWIAGWGFDPADGEADLSTETVTRRIREFIGDPDIDVEVLGTSVWQVNEAYATTFGKGRVFCAGDAVHRHPPSGGLGSNTSVQDSANLAWKLAYVLKGWAGPELLETYEAERVPVGRHVVGRANQSRRDYVELHAALGQVPGSAKDSVLRRVSDPSDEGVRARDALGQALAVKQYEFNALGVEHNQRYSSAAVISDGNDDEQWSEDPELYATPTTRPGAKLPHTWLVGPDGRRVSTLDVVGAGCFTLVTGCSGTDWPEVVGELDLPYLRCVVVDGPEVADLYRSWQEARQIDEAGALLVRPDGYIAWRHAVSPDDRDAARHALTAALEHVLSLSIRTSEGVAP
ncbi:FAD-dependent monooxygenase [Georgenia sp. Z1491]|uniref:FAD-dependent monooxygenase n=1 Tax=Georgenia sp. Z1491 TaxID=3416707 RepID=UPI003CF6D19D